MPRLSATVKVDHGEDAANTSGLPLGHANAPGCDAGRVCVHIDDFPLGNQPWLGTESNRRHADFQSAALPTELPSPKSFNLFELFGSSQRDGRARGRRRRPIRSRTGVRCPPESHYRTACDATGRSRCLHGMDAWMSESRERQVFFIDYARSSILQFRVWSRAQYPPHSTRSDGIVTAPFGQF